MSVTDLCARCGGDCGMSACPECGGCEDIACKTCAGAGPDEPCFHRCGYVSSGADLLDHELLEHVRCTECGADPIGVHPVIHEPDCPRLAAAAGEGGA
jgi:hypothetical protein